MLKCFSEYGVVATFATVGFLFAESREDCLRYCPATTPDYKQRALSPYNGHFDSIVDDKRMDPYHFAPELIELIRRYPRQEIASHTFSHFYCLEKGQTQADFERDLAAATAIGSKNGYVLKSMVFPRNQVNEAYLGLLRKNGIITFRGTEKAWYYSAETEEKNTRLKRLFRLLDTYVNLSGHNCYSPKLNDGRLPVNLPASRFLRPYAPRLKFLERLRLRRICGGMTHAAKNGEVYHLWWHPHNFGKHQKENFRFLQKILAHYAQLRDQYGFTSQTMSEVAESVLKAKAHG